MLKVILVILMLSLGGCTVAQQQYALTSSNIALEASVLKKQYAEVALLLKTIQSKDTVFTTEEWDSLNEVDSTVNMIVMKYEALTHFQDSSISLDDVKFMYRLTTDAYKKGRDIVFNHWDELTPSTQILLNGFENRAVETSEEIQSLLNDPNNESINRTLTLIAGIMGTTVKILSLVAL